MRRALSTFTAILALGGALAACGDDENGEAVSGEEVSVELTSADGGDAGTVELLPDSEGHVEVSAEVSGLEPGFHGFHIHETGTCEPDSPMGPFETAGGHFATGSQRHGEHAGDMPTLVADQDGEAEMTVTIDSFTLDDLADGDGSAVMVHADRDNQANIPDRYRTGGGPGPDMETLDTGDAGDRVACGVVAEPN